MKKAYCLDLDNGRYTLGDLNLMLQNKETMSYPLMDPKDPARPFFTGPVPQRVTVDGEERPFLLYIPSRFPISGAGTVPVPG